MRSMAAPSSDARTNACGSAAAALVGDAIAERWVCTAASSSVVGGAAPAVGSDRAGFRAPPARRRTVAGGDAGAVARADAFRRELRVASGAEDGEGRARRNRSAREHGISGVRERCMLVSVVSRDTPIACAHVNVLICRPHREGGARPARGGPNPVEVGSAVAAMLPKRVGSAAVAARGISRGLRRRARRRRAAGLAAARVAATRRRRARTCGRAQRAFRERGDEGAAPARAPPRQGVGIAARARARRPRQCWRAKRDALGAVGALRAPRPSRGVRGSPRRDARTSALAERIERRRRRQVASAVRLRRIAGDVGAGHRAAAARVLRSFQLSAAAYRAAPIGSSARGESARERHRLVWTRPADRVPRTRPSAALGDGHADAGAPAARPRRRASPSRRSRTELGGGGGLSRAPDRA